MADTITDDGMLTLSEAVQAANTNASENEVDAGQGELMIPDSLQLSLGVAETMTIDALGASGVLNVGAGVEGFSLRGLTLSGGMADLGSGLLVGSASRVTLANVNVTDYLATGNAVSGMFDSNGLFTASINDLFNPTHTLVLVTGSR